MSASTPATQDKNIASSALRTVPAVITFDGDEAADRVMTGIQRYARLKFKDLQDRVGETIVAVSNERLLKEHASILHGSNIRVLAICNTRFRDPRLDALVYGYLPQNTPPPLVERMLDNALDHIHLLMTRRDVNARLAGATREINELNKIGAQLSAEHDTAALLERILTKCREITHSDAGSLYLVEEVPFEPGDTLKLPPSEEEKREYAGAKIALRRRLRMKKMMRFMLAQNDTFSVPFRETVMEISDKSIAGYVVKTGEIVNLEDAYHLPGDVPYSFNRKFDEDSGYRTKSMLAVPMRNPKPEDASSDIVGVIQLINAKRDINAKLHSLSAVVDQVVPYTARQQDMVASLASQAAVALENNRLYERIQTMFEGFVSAAVSAIEARDPTTSGHSFRVADLTVALAETVDRTGEGPYAGVHFTRDQMREIRYASLLHDFGKVGVREEVLVKAKKLYPARIDVIRQRFQFVKRSMQVESLLKKLDYLLEKGREEYLGKLGELDGEIAAQLQEVDDYFRVVEESNEPSVLPAGNFERLAEIAALHFFDFDGEERALLTPDEVRLLSIRKGSLDESERLQIESHVVHSYNFLSQIPWTKGIGNIPEIARGHHEKLTGTGYPYKLSAPEIPLQTRMMTIADIFDALAASDRPYKKAVTPERALQILEMEVADGELDANLFKVFLEAKIWQRWKKQV